MMSLRGALLFLATKQSPRPCKQMFDCERRLLRHSVARNDMLLLISQRQEQSKTCAGIIVIHQIERAAVRGDDIVTHSQS